MTAKILLSPTENKLSAKLGKDAITSSIPEQKGADVLILTNQGLFGIQRKEVPNDFLLSIADGRMARGVALLSKSCKFSRVLGEGRFRYWPDGRVLTGQIDKKTKKPLPSRFTRAHIRGMVFDIEFVMGVSVNWTENIDETVDYIRHIPDLINKGKHLGLYTRPSAQGTWFVPKAKDIHLWLLQSFPGIGPATADKIVEAFGGDIPMRWTCSYEELASVPGLSKTRAQALYEALEGKVPASPLLQADKTKSVIDDIRAKLG